MKPDPPHWPLRFLRWFCHEDFIDEIEGDLMENYFSLYEKSSSKAGRQFTWDVIKHFRPEFIRSFRFQPHHNNISMLKNYFKIAIRQLRRNSGYSFINIFGLATGMAIALVIGIWTVVEHSVDKSYPDHNRIVEIMQAQRPKGSAPGSPITYIGTTVSSALKPYLQKGYNDIFDETAMFTWPYDGLLVNGDKSISRLGSWVEYTFPKIFGYQFLSGNAESLRDPNTALISRSAAIALFGNENAVGKTFIYNNKLPFTVGGVYTDQPSSSSFHDIDFFIPISHPWMNWITTNTDFDNHSCRIFGRLAGNTSAAQAEARIKDICTPYNKHNIETYTVMPFEDLYLHYDWSNNGIGEGRISRVRLVGMIGVFVLLLACINFMNLSTARSEQRVREVGIRKTLGSLRGQLIWQFLSESILVALLAFVFAIILTAGSLPWFSSLSGSPLTLPWTSLTFWTISLGFIIVTGLIAGSYPAFYLSHFRPVKVLKGVFKTGKGAITPRKVLVVTQFSISLALIIGTITVFRQIQFAKNRPVGYDRAALINVPINSDSLDRHYESIHMALLNTGMVANMASSSTSMTSFSQNDWMEWAGMNEEQKNITFRDVWVSADFGSTVGWTVLSGRDFSRNYGTDSNSAIVNEEGARILGFKDPIGKTVKLGKLYTIIGVTKNMLVNDPYDKIQPAIFLGEDGHSLHIIRIKPGTPIRTALAKIESVYKKFNPTSPFLYHFNDEDYDRKFQNETQIGNLATVFSGLAILISCLGLFGLASFVAEQRTKEIGVRKVLGARVVNLWALLSGDFLKLVMLSCIVSMPLSYFFMSRWLENYTLHTSLSLWIFVAAGASMLSITLATVSYQALKAALMNPVKSLRTE
jgi:putative ABC transport system permease protein